jgi:hypothetical protein
MNEFEPNNHDSGTCRRYHERKQGIFSSRFLRIAFRARHNVQCATRNTFLMVALRMEFIWFPPLSPYRLAADTQRIASSRCFRSGG